MGPVFICLLHLGNLNPGFTQGSNQVYALPGTFRIEMYYSFMNLVVYSPSELLKDFELGTPAN